MTNPSSTGVFWPEGQALPWFAAPTELEVLDLTQASAADVLLASTAQGVVNRNRPQIWLLREAEEGSHTWLDTLALPGATVVGVEQLITRHRRESVVQSWPIRMFQPPETWPPRWLAWRTQWWRTRQWQSG